MSPASADHSGGHPVKLRLLDPRNPRYRWLVLANVMIATFMAVLDATIVTVALPKLMAHFGVTIDSIEWVLTAYLLVFSIMLPTTGWLGDRFGHKRVFMLGLLLFTSGSFLCSIAWSFDAFITFRILQGAGAGAILPLGMAILMREFPPEKRGIALGFWTVSASASVSLGPTLGGYLIDNYSWRMIFDVNVPIGITGIIVSVFILREYIVPEIRRFDAVGFVSMAAFLGGLLLALANGNAAWNTGGWTSQFILSCFFISLLGLLVFVITESTVANPLIDVSLFRSRNFTIANLVLFIFGLGMFGSNFLLPIYLQNSLGYTPFQAGLVFLPVGLILAVVGPLAGAFSDRVSAKAPAFVGLVLLAYALYRYRALSAYSMHHQIMVPLYIRGVAMGMIFSPLTTLAIMQISQRKMAQASGLINVIRQVGGSFGVALFGTLLSQRTIFHAAIYGQQLDGMSPAFQATAERLTRFALAQTGGPAAEARSRAGALIVQFAQKEAFISSVDDVFLVASVVVLISALPVLLLKGRKAIARGRDGSGRPAA
jgi:DHA2 family multidrug resistance protein